MNMKAYLEHFQQHQSTCVGHDLPWLVQIRAENFAHFTEIGFPHRHQENWKYTDLSFLAKKTYRSALRHTTVTKADIQPYQLADTQIPQLVFINGYFDPALSNLDPLPSGITLQSLHTALSENPEKIKSFLHAAHASVLENVNTAFFSDGVFLHVAKNTQAASPIHLLLCSTESTEDTLQAYKNICILEKNTQLTIFEQHVSLAETNTNAQSIKNTHTHFHLQQGANLHYYKLQQENKNTVHLAETQIEQLQDSQLTSHSISLGGKLTRENLHVALNAIGASCELNGFYALADAQHTDHHTRIDHFFPQGTSKECYKGILNDQAKGVFNGKVIVHPNAQKTSAQQVNKNILLSNTAEINTKPELEIYADDVQCTHGATVGEIDRDALFYLQSRGLDLAAARALLVHAFCDEVLERMAHPAIAQQIKAAAAAKINALIEV
jgi:Fe-S cluster assembly protein SufD